MHVEGLHAPLAFGPGSETFTHPSPAAAFILLRRPSVTPVILPSRAETRSGISTGPMAHLNFLQLRDGGSCSPEGCLKVAGGRSAAETSGAAMKWASTPAGVADRRHLPNEWKTVLAPLPGYRESLHLIRGVSLADSLHLRLPSGSPPGCGARIGLVTCKKVRCTHALRTQELLPQIVQMIR